MENKTIDVLINDRLASDLWDAKIARLVAKRKLSERRKRIAFVSSAVAAFVVVTSIVLYKPGDTTQTTIESVVLSAEYSNALYDDFWGEDPVESVITQYVVLQ